jgi:hypothetical protein
MSFFNEYLSEMKERLGLRALSSKKIQRNYLIIRTFLSLKFYSKYFFELRVEQFF